MTVIIQGQPHRQISLRHFNCLQDALWIYTINPADSALAILYPATPMQTRLRPEHYPQDLRRQSVKKDPPLVGDNNTLALDLLQARRFGDRVLLRHFGFGRGDGLRLHK